MKRRNWVWGIFFLLAAVFVICSQLGYTAPISVWKIALTALLGAMAVQSLLYLEFFGVFVPLAVIGFLFAEPLGLKAITPWPLIISAVFLSIGCHILFHRHVKRSWHQKVHKHTHPHVHDEEAGHREHFYQGETQETISDDVVSCEVAFAAAIKYLHAEKLRSANFTCSFGSLKVYFDQARLDPDGARVNVECSFGGMELYIPRKWHVIDKINPTLGSVKSNYNAPEQPEATLTLTGNVQFGRVEIIYI